MEFIWSVNIIYKFGSFLTKNTIYFYYKNQSSWNTSWLFILSIIRNLHIHIVSKMQIFLMLKQVVYVADIVF
jgi:hypothetical protein